MLEHFSADLQLMQSETSFCTLPQPNYVCKIPDPVRSNKVGFFFHAVANAYVDDNQWHEKAAVLSDPTQMYLFRIL